MKVQKAGKSVKTESNNRIISILILGILVISFFSLSIGLNEVGEEGKKNTNTNPDNEKKLESVIGIPISSWFNNSEDPIYVDATATGVGAHNWTWARNQDWCREGDGTQGNPYLIENISIDCLDSGSGIYINNSNGIHFTLRNCSVIQSGINAYDAGIRLENTTNGTLVNNFCCNNGYGGIVLSNYSSWNLLSNNTVNNNTQHGIYLFDYSVSNTISNNNANDNAQHGIFLSDHCVSNTISNNTANSNTQSGIFLYGICDSNTISNNTAINNSMNGIYLNIYCDFNTISNNTVNNNSMHGIHIYQYCDFNTISNNTANNNSIYGIYLYSSCDFNTIYNNTLYNNNYGIYIQTDSNGNTIYYNKLSNLVGNAYDDNTNNWDNSTIGNFWSNYTGKDLDHNGIGDTPHEVLYGSGIYDNFPQIVGIHQKPSDIQIEIGTLDVNLIWVVNTYLFGDYSYEITENGVLKFYGLVNEGNSEIMFSVGGLEEGRFSYLLTLTGATELYDIVDVIVINSIPEITIPIQKILYEIGSLNNIISWNFTDPSIFSAVYSVYRDEIEILSDIACNPNENIDLSIDGLSVGEYIYRIVVNDGYGKTATKLTTIIVNNAAPVISVPVVDILYEFGSLDNNIWWSFSDISVSNPSYNLYRNGLPILIDESCNLGEQIVISVDGLEAGLYIYVIELNDGYGNTITESVTVTVNAQEEKTDFSSYIIAFTIGLSIIAAAIIIRRKPTKSTKGSESEYTLTYDEEGT